MAKKEEYRFTIQFSSTDPRHLQAADILNRQGRRKAQYLVNAILFYENGAETNSPMQPPLLNYHMIEDIVNQILAEKALPGHQQVKKSSAESENKLHQSEKITFEDATSELGQDALSAVVDSIAAFRKI